MAGLADVLERLRTDATFMAQLVTDPRSALAGYDLSADDLSELAKAVGADERDAVEQRTSKAAFFSLFAQLAEDDPA